MTVKSHPHRNFRSTLHCTYDTVIETTDLFFTAFGQSGSSRCFRWFALFCRGVSRETTAKQRKQWASKFFQIAKTVQNSENGSVVSITLKADWNRRFLVFSLRHKNYT